MRCELRFSHAGRDRSCPPSTAGSRRHTDPARTRGTRSPRPLLAVGDRCERCLGHVGGTAGEDERGRDVAARHYPACRVRLVVGDHSTVAKPPPGGAAACNARMRGWCGPTTLSGHASGVRWGLLIIGYKAALGLPP
jgi:hypothetical protein